MLKTVKRWVCSSCGAVWFAVPGGKCPSCKGAVEELDCTEDESGVVKRKEK
jgi:rubrerythrin